MKNALPTILAAVGRYAVDGKPADLAAANALQDNYVVLREYSPDPAILTREWVPPGIQKIK